MELKILTTFKTIIRTGSFSKAARQLNYTPSTITFHVAQLEETAGVRIFEKSGRRMALTQAGEALVPYVDDVLEAARKIQNFQYDISDYRGALTIGAPESMLCFRLPALLKRLHRQAPHVDLRLRSLTSRDVVMRCMRTPWISALFTVCMRKTGSSLIFGHLRAAPRIFTRRRRLPCAAPI